MDPLVKWRRALIGWILWPHNPEGQSDDRLNNGIGHDTAVNQLSPDLMMAWEWKSHLGTAWALGLECVCVWPPVCPCYTFTISAILWGIPYMIARGQTPVGGGGLVGRMLFPRKDFREMQGMYVCACERSYEIWFHLLDQCFTASCCKNTWCYCSGLLFCKWN